MMPVLALSAFTPEGGSFAIRRERHDSAHCPPWHGHDFIEIVFVESGGGWHAFGEGRYELAPDTVFFIRPGEPHRFDFAEGQSATICNCLIRPAAVAGLLAECGWRLERTVPPAGRTIALPGAAGAYVRELLGEMLAGSEAGAERGVLRIQFGELFMILADHAGRRGGRPPDESPRGLGRQIRSYLERHAHERLTLDALSAEFHLSRRQLERLVRQETGLSVVANLHQIRMARAAALLRDDQATVGEVAAAVGYEDPAFFSRLFAREVGVTPGRYRRERSSGLPPGGR